jgi:hypothetical protein
MSVTEEQIAKVGELLHEAAETHHRVYRIVDGADDDWASWYGDWLVRLSELPQLLGTAPVRSEVVYLLVLLNKEYTEQKPTVTWETYYARAILEHFAKQAMPAERSESAVVQQLACDGPGKAVVVVSVGDPARRPLHLRVGVAHRDGQA